MEWDESHKEYYTTHQRAIEDHLSEMVDLAVWEKADDPLEFIGRHLIEASQSAKGSATPDISDPGKPSLTSKPTDDDLVIMGTVKMAKQRWRNAGGIAKDLSQKNLLSEIRPGSVAEEQLRWRTKGWLAGPIFEGSTLAEFVATSLNEPLEAERQDGLGESGMELCYVKALGSYPNPTVVLKTLQRNRFVEKFSEAIWLAAQRLVDTSQTGSTQTGISKFFDSNDDATIAFGKQAQFFNGLDVFLGPPNPNLRETMQSEHTDCADSNEQFETPNYKTATTPAIEFWFVVDPTDARRRALKIVDWPKEQQACVDAKADPRNPSIRRFRHPRPFVDFEFDFNDVNVRLKSREMQPMRKEEFFGGRLYTGPMYCKYNHVLRVIGKVHLEHENVNQSDISFALEESQAKSYGTKGNRYTTTLHVINSAVVKLSRLTIVSKVYRGISGRALPERMRNHDSDNTRGGVEFGFLSCSLDREVARDYAISSERTPPIIFELNQGMIDRGADFSWLSQYPHEKEILFAPLTGIGIEAYRVTDDILIASARPNVNLRAKTIEQVMAKMRTSHIELVTLLVESLQFSGVPPRALTPLTSQKIEAEQTEPSWFNSAVHFLESTTKALERQKQVFQTIADPEESVVQDMDPESIYRTAELAAGAGLHSLAVDLLMQWRVHTDERQRAASSPAAAPAAAPAGAHGFMSPSRAGAPAFSVLSLEQQQMRMARYMSDLAKHLLADGIKVPWAGTLVELANPHPDPSRYTKTVLTLEQLAELTGQHPELSCNKFAMDSDVLIKDRLSDNRWIMAKISRERYDDVLVHKGKEVPGKICPHYNAKTYHELTKLKMQEVLAPGKAGLAAAMREAAHVGHADMVQMLIEARADAFEVDMQANTALIIAAQRGHVGVCDILKHKMDEILTLSKYNAKDLHNAKRQNAFDLAVHTGQQSVVRILSPNPSDQIKGLSECIANYKEIIRNNRGEVPLDHPSELDASSKLTTLMLACRHGDLDVVHRLLSPGRSGNHEEANEWRNTVLNASSSKNCTALTMAAEEGHVEVVEALLAIKADVNFADYETGRNALYYAATSGHVRVTQLLLNAEGVDPERGGVNLCRMKEDLKDGQKINTDRRTILMGACQFGHLECVKLLLAAKANLKATNHGGETALMFAARNGFDRTIKFLLNPSKAPNGAKQGIDLDDEVKYATWTSLHRAAANGHIASAIALLRHWQVKHPMDGEDRMMHDLYINWKDKRGITPLMAAAASGYEAMTALLLEQRADLGVEHLNSKGETALAYTAAAGQEGTLGVLLKQKRCTTGIDFVSQKGETALIKACKAGHVGVARALIDAKASVDMQISVPASELGLRWRKCEHAPTDPSLEIASDVLVAALVAALPGQQGSSLVEFSPQDATAWKALVLSSGHFVRVVSEGGEACYQPAPPDSPLMIAAKLGHEDLMRCLLINHATDRKREAFDIAKKEGHETLISLMSREKKAILQRMTTAEKFFRKQLSSTLLEDSHTVPPALLPDGIDEELQQLGDFSRQFSGQLVPVRPSERTMASWKGGKDDERRTECGKIGGFAPGGVTLQRGPFNGIWLRVGCVAGVPWHRLWSTLKAYVSHIAKCERAEALQDAIFRHHREALRGHFQAADEHRTGSVDFVTFRKAVEGLGIDVQPVSQRTPTIAHFFQRNSQRSKDRMHHGGDMEWFELNRFHYETFAWQKRLPKAVYVAISMKAMQAIDLTWLIEEHGFRFHHYRPAGHGMSTADEEKANESDGTGEMVYYLWPGIGGNGSRGDLVPRYATAIEGATGVCLSRDGKQMLLVWERGSWSTPGGAVNAGESKLEALKREIEEEINASIDLSRGATYVGGWSQARARDNLINDSFAAFVVHLDSDEYTPDDKEISEARFFEWRPLLEKWRADGRPRGEKKVVMALGVDDVVRPNGKVESRNKLALNLLQWLDVYESGGGFTCQLSESKQGDKCAMKANFVQNK